MDPDILKNELLYQAGELKTAIHSAKLGMKRVSVGEPQETYARGFCCRVATVNEDSWLDLYLDYSSGRLSQPMFWLGLGFEKQQALDKAVDKALPLAKPIKTLQLEHMIEQPKDIWLPKTPLTDQELDSTIAEALTHPDWSEFWLGRWFSDMDAEIGAQYVAALLGKEVGEGYLEGASRQAFATLYERDPEARRRALQQNGYDCCVCKTNFQKVYGELGKDFIHVHHVYPLAERKGASLTSLDGLVSVCPNCHAMLHRSWLKTPEELRDLMEQQRLGQRATED